MNTPVKCPLCSFEFDEKKENIACKSCVVGSRCGLLKCPNCGYEFPREAEWIKKVFRRGEKDGADGKG